MDFSFIAYLVLAAIVSLGIFSALNNSGRSIAAAVSLLLFLRIFQFYQLRWFRGTSSAFTYKGAWPPIINMCPDYLVYFKSTSGQDTCVDLIGVNNSGGALQAWNQADSPTNPPANANKQFPQVQKPGMTEAQIKSLCQAAMQQGLTWEGITNGEACTYTPATPSQGGSGSGAGGGQCS